jgi:predicted nuclease of restriction endonuclease-like RecB superfamily
VSSDHRRRRSARETLACVARELECAPDALLAGLYADLPLNQKLLEFEPISASELLELYNVAQAQALLYRCIEMRLTIAPQSTNGYRELFGAIKAYKLIHTVKETPPTVTRFDSTALFRCFTARKIRHTNGRVSSCAAALHELAHARGDCTEARHEQRLV